MGDAATRLEGHGVHVSKQAASGDCADACQVQQVMGLLLEFFHSSPAG